MTIALCWESLCARAGSPTLPGTPTCRAACGNTTVSRVDRAETPQTRVDRAVNHLGSMALWSCGATPYTRVYRAETPQTRVDRAVNHLWLSVAVDAGHSIQGAGGQVRSSEARRPRCKPSTAVGSGRSLHSTLTVQSGSGHYIQVSGGQVATRQVISDLL